MGRGARNWCAHVCVRRRTSRGHFSRSELVRSFTRDPSNDVSPVYELRALH